MKTFLVYLLGIFSAFAAGAALWFFALSPSPTGKSSPPTEILRPAELPDSKDPSSSVTLTGLVNAPEPIRSSMKSQKGRLFVYLFPNGKMDSSWGAREVFEATLPYRFSISLPRKAAGEKVSPDASDFTKEVFYLAAFLADPPANGNFRDAKFQVGLRHLALDKPLTEVAPGQSVPLGTLHLIATNKLVNAIAASSEGCKFSGTVRPTASFSKEFSKSKFVIVGAPLNYPKDQKISPSQVERDVAFAQILDFSHGPAPLNQVVQVHPGDSIYYSLYATECAPGEDLKACILASFPLGFDYNPRKNRFPVYPKNFAAIECGLPTSELFIHNARHSPKPLPDPVTNLTNWIAPQEWTEGQ